MRLEASRNLHDYRMARVRELIARRSAEREEPRNAGSFNMAAFDKETYQLRHALESQFFNFN